MIPAPSPAEAVLDHVAPGTDLIVPIANGEPVTVLDAIEARAEHLADVRVHQMHALRDRPYLDGRHGSRLRHYSYFLSAVTRPHFHAGGLELVPCNFSEVPHLLRQVAVRPLIVAAASPPDRHGFFSLGTRADYVAPFIGHVPIFLEVNARMPRTFGRNGIHASQIVGWCEADYPLVEVEAAVADEIDDTIAASVAERIPDGATIQIGIGAIPGSVTRALRGHAHLGVHTELLSDSLVDLIECGAVTGTRKVRRPSKVVATFALGTRAVYDFIHENSSVELLPVDWVNDPRVIAQQPSFVSVNATTEVDFLGQCASETVAGRYWSGSGGQADFARGAMYSDGGQGFVVLRSTAAGGSVSRIRGRLSPGSVVTTMKNTVDHVVTEYGVASLRGLSIRERTRALIGIAHPGFRDGLEVEARELGYL